MKEPGRDRGPALFVREQHVLSAAARSHPGREMSACS